ncbi:hypothetical protein FPOAC1_012825 [Fusarium poae]|uniref:hypothetical protein n=1 Tax=Fusarium poae TaxID=36050 RepID=UPI001CE907B1|nr:hypothetical protein FPOAC1_012825 [Fusarium poae]KAG8667983.1 hypothetical protein FPOAC1_012825 [Fusarium poae]
MVLVPYDQSLSELRLLNSTSFDHTKTFNIPRNKLFNSLHFRPSTSQPPQPRRIAPSEKSSKKRPLRKCKRRTSSPVRKSHLPGNTNSHPTNLPSGHSAPIKSNTTSEIRPVKRIHIIQTRHQSYSSAAPYQSSEYLEDNQKGVELRKQALWDHCR